MQDLYVGNLPYNLSEKEIEELFSAYGTIEKVTLIVDRNSGRKKGYGFVKICDAGAQRAIEELNLSDCYGRTIKVNIAPAR